MLLVCLVYAVVWLLAHVLLSLAMWPGVVYGWLAFWLAGPMALWLAGSLALLGKAILAGKFQRIFSFKITEKSPQNRGKIRGNFGGFEADFGTAKTKTEKPKTQNPHQKPRKENPKKKTQNPFKLAL